MHPAIVIEIAAGSSAGKVGVASKQETAATATASLSPNAEETAATRNRDALLLISMGAVQQIGEQCIRRISVVSV